MASWSAGQVAELDLSPYSALGRVGPEAGQKFKIVGSQADDAYHLSSGVYCADGHDHIFNHSGFYNSAVGRLIWSAILPEGNPDQAQEAVCDCAEIGDFEVVDTDEQSLPRIVDRELREVRRLAPTDADVTNLKVFFGNLHSHTKYSDGTGTPEEAFVHARDQAQLDFLALTEHNHTSNMADNGFRIGHNPKRYEGPNSDSLIPVAKSLTVDDSFIAIFGQEVSSISQGNHLNVFDVTKVISDQDVPNGQFDDLLDSWLVSHLDTQGEKAIVQLNHPWTSSSPNDKEYGRDDFADFATWRQKLGDHAKLIEVANGPSHSDGVGLNPATVSATEFRRYLKMGFHLAPTANQDNHRRTWGTITDARTAILADSLSKQNLLNALRNRRAYATLDKNLRLIASVEGHVIGSIIQDHINQGHELALEVTFQDDDEDDATYWVEVFADKIAGEDANTATNLVATYGPIRVENNSGTATTFVLPGLQYDGWDYLYLKVDQGPPDSPQTQAYLAPVWFE